MSYEYTLGVDLGGTKTEIIALDKRGSECFRKKVATVKASYADTIKTICALVLEAEQHLACKCPLGIAIPGAVSEHTKRIKNANSFWLNDQDLKGDLAKSLSKDEIFLENDANCFALSEAEDGAGKDYATVWGLILGTGSGSGIVINKQVLRGRNLLSGEWGHTTLPWLTDEERELWRDVKCYCARDYCIETFVSGVGFERDFAKRKGVFDPNALTFATTGKDIIELMAKGDHDAKACYEAYLDRLSRAIAAFSGFLDPDVIVLGGGMSNVNKLYEDLPDRVRHYIFGGEFDTPIVPNVYGSDSGVRGAAWLPLMHSANV